MNTEKIGYLEAIALITMVMINNIILNTPKDILSTTGPASWINVIIISIIAIFASWLLPTLFKKFQGSDILDVCDFLGGSVLKTIMGILYIFLLVFVPVIFVKNFAETLQIIYFKTSPLTYLLLFFIISTTIANKFSLKVLSKTNLILTPIALVSILAVLLSSTKDFDINRIFPILGYGANETFFAGLSNLFSFSGIGYLLFIGPFIDNTKHFKKISILSVVISAIYLFLSVGCILLSLSFTFKSGEAFSLYLLSRKIDFGRFVQRIDAIFIFTWIFSTISYISFSIYFCIYIFKKLTKISDTTSINYTINLFILGIILIPVNFATMHNIIQTTSRTASLILLFGVSFLILILANFKLKMINKKKGQV